MKAAEVGREIERVEGSEEESKEDDAVHRPGEARLTRGGAEG
jgi:hypothetical protein